MGLTAIGVQHIPSSTEDLYRVRVKEPGDGAWRTAPSLHDCCASDATRALVGLGISEDRARQMIDSARLHGTTAEFKH